MLDNEWFEQYKIGVPLIDADHLNLFREVARFNEHLQSGMSAEDLGKSLNFLDKYVGAHFAREEMLMREKAYPYYTQHKTLHLQLKKVVFAVRRVFETDMEKVDKEKLHQFLRDWLIEHILKVDAKLVPYVNGAYSNDSRSVERLQFIGLSEEVTIDEELVAVTVKVPQSKQKVIERCAFALMHNTPEAQDLEEIALAATGMTIEEAMELAGAVLY
ncbi:MAG: bacteriohemerythrin [Methylococcales bacterium]|jgi:hemerythrin|nr:bacteriohemerythrin [Methylococcales bacterium]